ncbi:MAG: GntR family transcriptional regulator, partial [Vallitaleaceae bacterium]|nr:GntR family transcriptional regulator [Vallitaleaceae bacterium]
MSQLEKFNKYTLDKSAPIPLYFQVKNLLVDMLHQGEISPGDMIPTEFELCDAFAISRTTIRQALSELVEEGIFYRVKGRGTFVSQNKVHHNLSEEISLFSSSLPSKGFILSTMVLEIKTMVATPEVLEALKLATATEVISIRRLQFANDEPLFVCQTYLPYTLCKNILRHNLSEEPLTALLAQNIHTKLAYTTYALQAATATKDDCTLLDISKITAVQLVHSIGY